MPQPRKLHDEYFKKAKVDGYLARSAYKLLEIDEKKNLIRKGDCVLDLGCAPGSWLQVAERQVGSKGLVLGIDLQDVRHEFGPTVKVLKGDAFTFDPKPYLEFLPRDGRFDVVLSDMAPNTTGHADDYASVKLCRRVLGMLPIALRPGGRLMMKVLEGAEFPELLKETKAMFVTAHAIKPKASRDLSREIFIVGLGFLAEHSHGWGA